jgi:hypothetical protein
VRQKYGETMPVYLRRFRETRNKCYNLTIGEKDLADLAFAGLSSYLSEKLEGIEFADVNQVMQRPIVQENHARDSQSHSRFREGGKEKERTGVGLVEDNPGSDEDAEVCMAKWVDTRKGKPVACSFLNPGPGKKQVMHFTFDVTKCDKLFDVLLQNNVIRLTGCHVIPPADQLAQKKYYKWNNSFSHTTNECNYFCRQIQSTLYDGRLTLGVTHQMKLDTDPFSVDLINFEEKRIPVQTDQAESTKGKNVVVSGQLWMRMMKPRNPETGVWKENLPTKPHQEWKPTSSFLIEKYVQQR